MMESKHRDAVYHQRCVEIMREARDLAALAQAASKALNHPEVVADTTLTAMVRAFIAEYEARLRIESDDGREGASSQLVRPFAPPKEAAPITRDQVVCAYNRLRLRLEEHLAHYNERGAGDILVSLWDLYERYPQWVDRASVERCQEQVRRLTRCRDEFRSQLDRLVQQARQAAQSGDEKSAAWLMRRLSAIHSLLPEVLPRERFEALAEEIRRCCQQHDQREAIAALMERERAVADEIKRIGALVHRCHKLAARAAQEPQLAAAAQAELRAAITELKAHDSEWLADLMLELDALMADLHDPQGRVHAQVDRFLEQVRQALVKLREQVQAVQAERGGQPAGRPPGGTRQADIQPGSR